MGTDTGYKTRSLNTLFSYFFLYPFEDTGRPTIDKFFFFSSFFFLIERCFVVFREIVELARVSSRASTRAARSGGVQRTARIVRREIELGATKIQWEKRCS